LLVWEKAHQMTLAIYPVTAAFPSEEPMDCENSLHMEDRRRWIGDVVDVALKAADERCEIEVLMRKALLANNDVNLKLHARRLVGLENDGQEECWTYPCQYRCASK